MDAEKFGTFIAARRKELGMTQADLAGKLHITDKAVSRWERGVGLPDINLIEPIANALQLEISEVMRAERQVEELKQEDVADMIRDTIEIANRRQARYRKMFFVIHLITSILLFGLLIDKFGQNPLALIAIPYVFVVTVFLYLEGKNSGNRNISFLLWVMGTFMLLVSPFIPIDTFEYFTWARPFGIMWFMINPLLGLIGIIVAVIEEKYYMIPLHVSLVFTFPVFVLMLYLGISSLFAI